jgi:hypothetical protein
MALCGVVTDSALNDKKSDLTFVGGFVDSSIAATTFIGKPVKDTSKKSPRATPRLFISAVKLLMLNGISVSLLLDGFRAKRSSYSS